MNVSTELYRHYEQLQPLVAQYPAFAPAFANVETVFEAKKAQPELSVMIYGVYNAGKSTLINALLGAECAPTGDVPLTAQVASYQWNHFQVLDTPGTDAPAEHEQITEAQLQKVDAVVFVVNPLGAAEEEQTLAKLVELLLAKKKVFLLFNEKHPLAPEDFVRLKDQTRTRLQALALARGQDQILAEIPIMRVNAQRALNGKLGGKPALIESSGIVALEQALEQFLLSVRPDDINQRLANTLQVFLTQVIAELSSGEQDELARAYQQLHERLVSQQAQCRSSIEQAISRGRKQISNRAKTVLHQNPESGFAQIEREFEATAEQVAEQISTELSDLVSQYHDDVDSLAATISTQGLTPSVQALPELGTVTAPPSTLPESPHYQQHKAVLTETAKAAFVSMKPEHIVGGLKLAKKMLPKLMKGIGPVTMNEWARMVGRGFSYLGPAITVLHSLYQIFSEDPAEKQLREYDAQVQQQRERFEQEVADLAADLGEQFEQGMNRFVRQEVEPVLVQLQTNMETKLASVNEQGKADRLALMQAQTVLAAIS